MNPTPSTLRLVFLRRWLGLLALSLATHATAQSAPTVELTSPANGAVFVAPASISLVAAVQLNSGQTIQSVRFYQGTTPVATAYAAPFRAGWNNVPAGQYTVTAEAQSSAGPVKSTAVTITVSAPSAVSLTAPAANAILAAGSNLVLNADATDSDSRITQVAFYRGSTLIGTATQAPYTVTWTNLPLGNYSLTARATDHLGLSTSSAPVPVTVTAAAAQAKIYYVHADHLDTPRLITDAQRRIVWRHGPLTESFGNSPVEEDPDGDGMPFILNLRFPGQYADQETNTSYNYFRDYDSATGRYIQSDPIGLQGGINTYGYVFNNPLKYTDPLGLEAEMCYRPIQGYVIPGQHCFVRFNGNDNDTSSFTPEGVGPDLSPNGATCEKAKGPEEDDCVKREMQKCKDTYNFLRHNCCHCAEEALKACGQSISPKKWPNWPINPGPQKGEQGYKP